MKVHDLPIAETVRQFDTGATRSDDTSRYDPEGFMSPIVIERFCEYMNRNRIQSDGQLRASDNWQKGIPLDTYIKGMWRHFLHLWTRFRGYQVQDEQAAASLEDDLCAIIFNAQGMLFETLKDKRKGCCLKRSRISASEVSVLPDLQAPSRANLAGQGYY